nr:peptidoglycan-binding protein [Lachnospiraceae bacterium]
IMATGAFKDLTDKKYLTVPDSLQEGDILVGPGHTAIVIEVKDTPVFERTLRTLTPRMKGEDVKKIQTILKSLNYYNGSINGTYAAKTEKAIIRYQMTHGLTADGICGKKTAESLGFKFSD